VKRSTQPIGPYEAACAYCRAGWSVIPTRATGKAALVRWRIWQRQRPDVDQLRAWFVERYPRANLAVVTGPLSGVVVLDVDPRHGGDLALAELEASHGRLPRLAVVETPSGGQHVYLAHPGGRVSNSAGRLGSGLDVRGDAGPALLPPSRRAAGAYRWSVGGPDAVPAVPPGWFPLIRPAAFPQPVVCPEAPREGAHSSRLAGLLGVLERAPEGRRNATLYWAACRLREMLESGAPESWVGVLEQAGVAAGLDQAEVRDTIASGLGRAER
jgi:bifunctional DNA primase/polymerase-like protein